MFKCPACAQPHNVYDTQCAACGAALPKYGGNEQAAPTAAARSKTHCTTCGHNRFVVFNPFKAYGDRNGRGFPMPAAVEDTQSGVPLAGGSFRAEVCLGCGLTEWYATAPARLEQLAAKLSNMTVVEHPPEPHPYR